MRSRTRRLMAVLLMGLAIPLVGASTAQAEIAPPWCGTPETDAAENLPDGTDPADPAGSFPHIPYYAIGCTLESIEAESDGRMTVEVVEDQSAGGRDMYAVTINALDTRAQQRSYARLERLAGLAWRNPRRAQQLIERRDAKVPLFIQGGIHGNEYEGVDASMRFIERLATTPYGTDPARGRRPRPRGGRLQPDPEPGRQGRRDAHQRQRLRPQPRLHHPVAARGPALGEPDPAPARSPRCSTSTATSRPRWWRRRPCPTTRGSSTTSGLKWNQPRLDANQARPRERGLRHQPPDQQHPQRRTRLDPRGRDAAPGLGRLGPVLHRPVRAAARSRRADDRDVHERTSRASTTTAASTACRPRCSAAPAPCARRSWSCSPRSSSPSRTAAS